VRRRATNARCTATAMRPTSAAPSRGRTAPTARPQSAAPTRAHAAVSVERRDPAVLPPTAVREAPYATLSRCCSRTAVLLGELQQRLSPEENERVADLIVGIHTQLHPLEALQHDLRTHGQTMAGLWRAEREISRLRALLAQSTQAAHPPPSPPPSNLQELVAQTGPSAYATALSEVKALKATVEQQKRLLAKREQQIITLTRHDERYREQLLGKHEGAHARGRHL